MERYRVGIIGAGVVGASIARVLSMYDNLEVHVFEKEADVGWGSTKANTGLIHAGYDDDPDRFPMRAKLCVRGNRLWHTWAKDLDIPVEWSGSLVVALKEEDLRELGELLDRARRNGVPGVRIVYPEELPRLEPNINPDAVAALWAPTAGKILPYEAAIALAENAMDNGAAFHLNSRVSDIKVSGGRVKALVSNGREYAVDVVINAAGLYADQVSRMVGINHFTITPRRGEYMLFDKRAEPKVRRTLFPTPTPVSKGVVVTTTVEGHLMLGPNAVDLPPDAKENVSTTEEGLEFVWSSSLKLVRSLPPRRFVIRTFAGLRAEPTNGDFVIEAYDDPWGFVNVAGIRSPGLTSSPAIAHYVIGLLRDKLDIKMRRKGTWNPYRRAIAKFSRASKDEREKLVKGNPAYGHVVCFCELVTEAEVLEAIKRGASTIDGVKFRTRAGMGRCQGSFCRYRIALILSRALGVPLWKITLRGEGTELGIGDVKMLLRGVK